MTRKYLSQSVPVVQGNAISQAVSIRSFLRDMPTKADLLFPPGYEYEEGMIITKVEKGKELQTVTVANEPVIMTGILTDVGSNRESVEIAAFHYGRWITEIVQRGIIANQKEIITLANNGFPVTSSNAKLMVNYLHVFEHANRAILPKTMVTKTLGWQPGFTSFSWGNSIIPSSKHIKFKGEDDGEERFATGLCKKGEYDEWIKLINSLMEYPKAIGMIYFSLMAPFIEVLGVNNFTVDLASETSKGKTTLLRCAASCWGNPDGGTEGRLVNPWESSAVWRERTAVLLRGIPLILDDTRPVRKKDEIGEFIYQFGNGEDKGRGTKVGTQGKRTIRSILLSSGEANLTEYTQGKGGAYGRLISLWGPPFGSGNQANFVAELNTGVREHFGHAGQKVVEFILRECEQWSSWKEAFHEYRAYFNEKADGNNLACRIGEYFAGLSTVIPLIHAALPELNREIAVHEIVEDLWKSAFPSVREVDTCTQAQAVLYSYAVANRGQFYDKNANCINQFGTIKNSGRWDKDGDFVSFDPETAKKLLTDAKFEPNAIFKIMKDRGWLICDKDNTTKVVTINGRNVRQYKIWLNRINDALNLDEE
jgi:uncharacterized protein (DUF927 family)